MTHQALIWLHVQALMQRRKKGISRRIQWGGGGSVSKQALKTKKKSLAFSPLFSFCLSLELRVSTLSRWFPLLLIQGVQLRSDHFLQQLPCLIFDQSLTVSTKCWLKKKTSRVLLTLPTEAGVEVQQISLSLSRSLSRSLISPCSLQLFQSKYMNLK